MSRLVVVLEYDIPAEEEDQETVSKLMKAIHDIHVGFRYTPNAYLAINEKADELIDLLKAEDT